MAARSIAELLRDYLVFSSRNDSSEIAQFTKVKELLGEAFADVAMDHKFGGQVQTARGVLNRGTKGPPIFDRVYELGDERFLLSGEEGMAVIDAKFGESPLGRTNLKRSYLVDIKDGKAVKIPLPQKRQVRQLQADWIKDRINELAKAEEKAAAGGQVAKDSLSARTRRAAERGNLQVYEVRTTLQFGDDGVPDVHVEIVDHTEQFQESYKTGRRAPADVERIAARKEAIADLYLKRSELQTKIDADTYTAARKRLKSAETQIGAAQKDLAAAKRSATKEKRQQVLEERQRAAKELEAEAQRAKQQTAKSEETRKLNEQLRDAHTQRREAEEAKKRHAERSSKRAEKDGAKAESRSATAESNEKRSLAEPYKGAGTADTAVSHASTDATHRGATGSISDEARGLGRPVGDIAVSAQTTADKMTDAALQADHAAARVVKKGAAESVARQAPRVTERAAVRAIARMALKGGRVVYTVGKVAFRVLEFANPVMDVLMVVDGIDLLVNWLQREKIAEERLWRRIAEFLSTPAQWVELPPYGAQYITSQEATISTLVANVMDGQTPGRTDDFMRWFTKWNIDKQWSGFVYATVWINLEQQEPDARGYPYEYTFWFPPSNNRLEIALSGDPQPNTNTKRRIGFVGETDERNHITMGREGPYADPKFAIAVDITELDIRYSYSMPVLTPFDFILVKVTTLITDIVAFLSRYDNTVYMHMDVRSDIAGMSFNWFARYSAGPPINVDAVRWCLDTLPKVADWLALHAPKPGDSAIPKQAVSAHLNTGYHRRLEVLRQVSGGPGSKISFRRIAAQLNHIVTDENPRYLLIPIDKDLAYLTPEYLADRAMDIGDDVARALKACQNPLRNVEYNYHGPPPPPPRDR